MTFWTWAVAAYGRPGVAEACLELQDGCGQSAPFLLWAAWAAQEGRRLTPEVLAVGADLARRWEAAAVGPLRLARRGLKPPMAGVADGAREGLRSKIKALELEAERLLIEALETLSPAPAAAGGLSTESALAAAGAAWSPGAPAAPIARLAQTLC